MAARAAAASARPAKGPKLSSRRPRGRPAAAPERDLRSDLLAAARELFLRYGYRAVSARQVAAQAGANPAMVHYYFKSKQGLYTAMLREATAPLIEALEEMLASHGPASADPTTLMAAYMRMVGQHPWIPGLLLREVFSPEGSYREDFIREFAGRVAPSVVELIRRGIAAGRMRQDLEPSLAVVSFMSLAVFPFIARPVLGRVLGQKFDGDSLEALIRHTTRLFAAGTAAGAKP